MSHIHEIESVHQRTLGSTSLVTDRLQLHPLKLSFEDKEYEQQYRIETLNTNYIVWRWMHILAMTMFVLFSSIQAILVPQHASLNLWIGYGVVSPMFLIGFAFTFTRFFRAWWQAANVLYVLVSGLGTLVLVVVLGPEVRFFSLIGFLFCFMFGYSLIHLRFPLASSVGVVLTAVFLGMCFFVLNDETALLSLGVFYVVGFNILGMFVAYILEKSDRRQFHVRNQLKQQREQVRKSNESLEAEVVRRTAELTNANMSLKAEIQKSQLLSTERDEIQQQFQQSQKLETVGRLAGGIAHDFNNLLTVINSYAELAGKELRDEDPLKSDLQQIKEAGDRAANLTRQLLAFSRKQLLEPQVLNLNAVVNSLESMVRRLIGENIELLTVLDGNIGMVSADPGQIEQVLMNLAVNARDAMPAGGKLTVETRNVYLDDEFAANYPEAVTGTYTMLAVTDTGEGMTSEVRDQLFEPFFTTKEKGRGTGLGLATVYGIIKQSGGNILVYSEPEQGTTFKIYLPQVESEAIQKAVTPKEKLELRGNETVLVVEDEPAVRELASRILQSAGYRPIVAANGGEALLECKRHTKDIQLVLTDVVMPKMNGNELAERLEKLSPGLRVLYMSGYTENAIVHQGVLDAGTNFIAKPFNAPALLEKVRIVLDSD